MTNAVRCVPPANKPTPAEIATCRRFLLGELAGLTPPRLILALGRIAHETVLRTERAEHLIGTGETVDAAARAAGFADARMLRRLRQRRTA